MRFKWQNAPKTRDYRTLMFRPLQAFKWIIQKITTTVVRTELAVPSPLCHHLQTCKQISPTGIPSFGITWGDSQDRVRTRSRILKQVDSDTSLAMGSFTTAQPIFRKNNRVTTLITQASICHLPGLKFNIPIPTGPSNRSVDYRMRLTLIQVKFLEVMAVTHQLQPALTRLLQPPPWVEDSS